MISDREERGPPTEDGIASSSPRRKSSEAKDTEPDFLSLARDCFSSSRSYFEASLLPEWETDRDHFMGKHPSGSKYHSDQYKGRSKLFRPKTRAAVRKAEAATAAAFFSTDDVLAVNATDEMDQASRASAAVWHEVLNHRLNTDIPWFLLLNGARQDAEVYGVCVSRQSWEYEAVQETIERPLVDPMTGMPVLDEEGNPIVEEFEQPRVLVDRPRIELFHPERLRIDPNADFCDPVNDSPFVCLIHPMYVVDVKARMGRVDGKTDDPEWYAVEDNVLKSARQLSYESDHDRDRANRQAVSEYDEVYCLEWWCRWGDTDWYFWTLGTDHMLTDPVPAEEVFGYLGDGERPVVVGYSTLETHTAFPQSKVSMLRDLQRETNNLANLHADAMNLSLVGRPKVKTGNRVPQSLLNGVSGLPLMLNDPVNDIIWDRAPEPGPTAFERENRLNADFDDLAGVFNTGTTATNRELNETVGGMMLLAGSANSLSEYDLRVFTETWVEPVLRQLVKLEKKYESDTALVGISGQRAQTAEKYGFNPTIDDLERADVRVTVNVGIGSTDPMQQATKFHLAMQGLMQVAMGLVQVMGPGVLQTPGFAEIAGEYFGRAGYKDFQRFLDLFPQGDPEKQQMGQMIQQLQGALADRTADRQTAMQIEQMKQSAALQREEVKGRYAIEDQRAQNLGDINEILLKGQVDAQKAVLDARLQPAVPPQQQLAAAYR